MSIERLIMKNKKKTYNRYQINRRGHKDFITRVKEKSGFSKVEFRNKIIK